MYKSLASTFLLLAATSAPLLAQDGPSSPPSPAATTNACNAECVRANMEKAARACARPIEAQAPIDYEWVTRPFAGLFDEADPSAADSSVVRYRGDSIRFMTAQNTWIRISYECAFDVSSGRVTKLDLKPGRVGRPLKQSASQAPAGAGTPKIRADLLAKAIAKAARQANKQHHRPSKVVRMGEPSTVEVEQIRRPGANPF